MQVNVSLLITRFSKLAAKLAVTAVAVGLLHDIASLVPRPFPYLTACARGKEGSGKMLGLSAGPGILSAYRKRNIQVAVKPQCTYIHVQQLH